MQRHRNLAAWFLVLGVSAGAVGGACSSGDGSQGSSARTRDAGLLDGDGSTITFDAAAAGLAISPPALDLVVDPSTAPDSVSLQVTGQGDRDVLWRLTNPALGSISQDGVFTPSGKVGGQGEIEAIVGGVGVRAKVTVTLVQRQNGGDPAVGDPGPGGLGGVGGEGEGGAVAGELAELLGGRAAADPALTFLYPYDETVFPLGILPPLLQWTPTSGGRIEAISVRLRGGPHYDYEGTFGRPPALGADADFVRHPIPRAV